MGKKERKVRVSFQKNRTNKPRERDWTRKFNQSESGVEADESQQTERIRAKGDLSRKRTIRVDEDSTALSVDSENCLRGRVLTVQGLYCIVIADNGEQYHCFVRRLLKSLESESRNVVTTGDWVWFAPAPDNEGFIQRVEPRTQILTRRYRLREHIIAANVDQVLIIGSLADPPIKPNLVDRYLVSAQRGSLRPLICFNKVDLADGYLIQPLVGLYSQLGYRVLLTSARTGQGIDLLKNELQGRETVVVGQSGVGKSSLLNALDSSLHLKVSEVSNWTRKGKHTTTNALLIRLTGGGTVIDTPGIRQFELSDVDIHDVHGYFVEMRPFSAHCKFPGCTHVHEDSCRVKSAVDQQLINEGRYESYLRMIEPA